MAEKTHYIDNEDLMSEWQRWLSSGDTPETRTISDELARMMMTIADRILQSRYFCGYPQATREDIAGESVLKMIRNLKNYKADKGDSIFLSEPNRLLCVCHISSQALPQKECREGY